MKLIPPGLLDAISIRKSRCRRRKNVELRALINLCSLQAVPLREVLLNPRESASAPLLDLWESYTPLPLSYGPQYKKAHAFDVALRQILRRFGERCLPAMQEVLRTVQLTCEQAKDLKPEIYLRYQGAYLSQGSHNTQTKERRALRCAMRILAEREPPGKGGRPKIHGFVSAIAQEVNISMEAARVALDTARAVIRVLRNAKVLLTRANPVALDDPAWTRGFFNHSDSATKGFAPCETA